MAASGGSDEIHFQAEGDALDDRRVIGFDKRDDIGFLGFDDFGKWISSAFAAVENVVTYDSHDGEMLGIARGGVILLFVVEIRKTI